MNGRMDGSGGAPLPLMNEISSSIIDIAYNVLTVY